MAQVFCVMSVFVQARQSLDRKTQKQIFKEHGRFFCEVLPLTRGYPRRDQKLSGLF